jgi:hypothetical protein
MKHDVHVHKRFLDYRERHVYFGKKLRMLDYEEFAKLDHEQRALEKLGEEGRDDEEEARFRTLSTVLFRD